MSRLVALILLLVTAAYLCIEMAFNARLLDVAANPMDSDGVHGIEFWGRIISGVAVALMIAASLVTQAAKNQKIPFFHWVREGAPWSPARLWGLIAATSLVSVVVVFHAEKAYVNHRAELQPAQTLHDAAFAVAIAQYVQGGGEVEKIPLSPQVLVSPEGKAFSAMFAPYYVNVISRLPSRRAVLTVVLGDFQTQNLPETQLYGVYINYVRGAQTLYNDQYIDGVKTYFDGMDEIPSKASSAYDDFVRQLGNYGYTPDTVPADMNSRVRSEARDKFGVRLPSDWVATDRDAFEAKIAAKIQREIESQWKAKATELGVAGLSPNYQTFNSFFLSKPVQNNLRKKLKDKYDLDLTVNLSPKMQPQDFKKRVYVPLIKDAVDRNIELIDAPPNQYAAGGSRYCNGVENYKALMLPGFAMFVSLVGIFYHSRKLLMYAWTVAAGPSSGWTRRLTTLTLPLVMCLIPLLAPSGPIRASEGYKTLKRTLQAASPGPEGMLYDWVIRAQPVFYPLSSAVHQGLGNSAFSAGKSIDVCSAAKS